MQLEGLKTVSDTAPPRLPAVARYVARTQPGRAVDLHQARRRDRPLALPQPRLLISMNDEAPDLAEAAVPAANVTPPADLLRALLDEPKPKDESWQAEAARAVSMLAVRFLSETSDELAMRTVALLSLAQSLGVKEARKRALKLTRWTEAAPPPLTTLAQKDEQHAAMGVLAKLTTPWARPYAQQALTDLSLPEEFVAELLKWVRTTHLDSLSFVRESYAPLVAAAKTAERTSALLKEAGKLLKPGGPEAAANLADGTAALVDALLRRAQPETDGDKAFAASVAALLHLLQDQAASTPAILLQPGFVMAFARLSGAAAKGSTSKQVTSVADVLSLATISLLSADFERHGKQVAIHWNAMVPTWRAAYSNWDAAIAAAARLSPALLAITSDRGEDSNVEAEAYATEAVFARLLPAWSAFVAELPDASRATSLSSMLHQAAGTLGIAALGAAGEVVGYDPLSHHLAEDDGKSPAQVRILRPGVQVQRPDGSSRVLVAALVAAV